MVRQECLNESGLEGVQVTFRTFSVHPQNIQAPQLLEHVRASLREAQGGRTPTRPNTTRKWKTYCSLIKLFWDLFHIGYQFSRACVHSVLLMQTSSSCD